MFGSPLGALQEAIHAPALLSTTSLTSRQCLGDADASCRPHPTAGQLELREAWAAGQEASHVLSPLITRHVVVQVQARQGAADRHKLSQGLAGVH